MGIVQGLYAQTVTRKDCPLSVVIPEHDGKHALQVLNEPVTVIFIEVGQDFGIAATLEPVAPGFKALPGFHVVVQLTVLGCPDGAAFIGERLMAAFHVDDAKPTRSDRYSLALEQTAVIGSPDVPFCPSCGPRFLASKFLLEFLRFGRFLRCRTWSAPGLEDSDHELTNSRIASIRA